MALMELMALSKSALVKEIRQDQLCPVKDSHNNDIVLGQGRFSTCKLVSLSVSGESVRVAVKQYTESTSKEAVVDEAYLLSRISHKTFPFVFGVLFGELHNSLGIRGLWNYRGDKKFTYYSRQSLAARV